MAERIRKGSAKWWMKKLIAAVEGAEKDPSPITLALLRSISQAARAASAHAGVEAQEAEIAELEARAREIESRRKRGTGALGNVVRIGTAQIREGQEDMNSGRRTQGPSSGT